MKYLNKGCKFLNKLTIMNCPNISKDLIEKMRGNIREIEHFIVPVGGLNLPDI